jgi:hypothetical protein
VLATLAVAYVSYIWETPGRRDEGERVVVRPMKESGDVVPLGRMGPPRVTMSSSVLLSPIRLRPRSRLVTDLLMRIDSMISPHSESSTSAEHRPRRRNRQWSASKYLRNTSELQRHKHKGSEVELCANDIT